MTTTKIKSEIQAETYFADDNGAIVCPEHLGHMGKRALEANPKAKVLPFGSSTWVRMTAAEIAHFRSYFPDWTTICESCNTGNDGY